MGTTARMRADGLETRANELAHVTVVAIDASHQSVISETATELADAIRAFLRHGRGAVG